MDWERHENQAAIELLFTKANSAKFTSALKYVTAGYDTDIGDGLMYELSVVEQLLLNY